MAKTPPPTASPVPLMQGGSALDATGKAASTSAGEMPSSVSMPATMMPDLPALPEIMYEAFEYRAQGRRPGSYFAFGVWLIMANLAWVYAVPGFVWGLLAFFLVILGWWLVRNPISGMTLSDTHLEIFNGDVRWKIPLTDIDCVIRTTRKGGKPGYKLHFTDGKTDTLPLDVLPRADVLTEEFRKRGLRIVDDAPDPLR